jgi:transposase
MVHWTKGGSFDGGTTQDPVELQERAVRLSRPEQPRRPIAHLAGELGVHPEALRNWIRQDEANRGERDDRLTSEQLEELRRLRKGNAELRRTNEILKAASRFSAAELDRPRTR